MKSMDVVLPGARPAARILLIAQSSVLLVHAQEPASGHRFWATPGGGLRAGETFEAAADGEFRPLSDDTTVSFRLSSDTLQATFKGPAGQSDAQTCTLSADQKQMICKGILTKGNGQTADYVDVYDRM